MNSITPAAIDLAKRERPTTVVATGVIFHQLTGTYPTATVVEVLESHRNGVWGEESLPNTGYPVLRSTNMRGKKVEVRHPVWCDIESTKAEPCVLTDGDILITKSSGSPDLVGKACLFEQPSDGQKYLFSNFILRLRPRTDVIVPNYLAWFLRSPQALSWRYESQQNAVGLRNLQTKSFLSQQLPLPDKSVQEAVATFLTALDEGEQTWKDTYLPGALAGQRQLVERADALVAKIEEARGLYNQIKQGMDELCRSILRDETTGSIQPTPMSELVKLRHPDIDVLPQETYHFAGVYCFGRGVFPGERKTGLEFKYPKLTRLEAGNFVYPKLMAWEGALATVPSECYGLVVSTEFPVFEVNTAKVLPEVLDVYFRTPSVWPKLSGASTGTNVRRRRLNPSDFLRYKFPLPSMATQLCLRDVRRHTDEAKKHQESSARELKAMLPAILDRAFRGEL